MRNDWILVADEERAKLFFKTEQDEQPVLLREFNNISGRARECMFRRFPIGVRSSLRGNNCRGLLLGVVESSGSTTRRFARDLCDLLEQSATRGAYERLALVAPAPFLELLREEMGPSALKLLVASLAKDLMIIASRNPGGRLGDIMNTDDPAMALCSSRVAFAEQGECRVG